MKSKLSSRTAWARVLALAIVLSACTINPPATPVLNATPTPEIETSNELRIFNYDTYIDPSILDTFQQRTGAVIQYDTYDNQDEMYEVVLAGEELYDLIVVTDYLVPVMTSEGLLLPLNKENIPNLANLDPNFLSPAFDPGGRYCAPYQWGTIGIGYNKLAIYTPPSSWKDLFEPQYAGQVALLEDSRAQMGIGLLMLGHSPNTTDAIQIAEMEQLFLANKDKILTYAPDNGQDLLEAGDADMVVEYNGDIMQMMEDNSNIQYVIPKEGTVLWVDSICIPYNVQNRSMAEEFINYLLEPQVSADLSNYTRYSTPNAAAMQYINEADRNNPALYPSDELRRKLFYIVDVGQATNLLYEAAWSEILASVSQ
jgi:spermidine/putrescine transport system substrate-binding protein